MKNATQGPNCLGVNIGTCAFIPRSLSSLTLTTRAVIASSIKWETVIVIPQTVRVTSDCGLNDSCASRYSSYLSMYTRVGYFLESQICLSHPLQGNPVKRFFDVRWKTNGYRLAHSHLDLLKNEFHFQDDKLLHMLECRWTTWDFAW